MPPPAWRWASTLASTGAPLAAATPCRRARSAGLAAGSRPLLLSPQTTRSGRAPAGRARLSRSLARNLASTGPTTPGWTNATRAVPAGAGAGRSHQKATAARGRATAAAAAVARVGPGTPRPTAAAAAPVTATSRKLTPQTPPMAATDSSAGAFHWLAPSSPQGPPSPSQDRSASATTNALGTSTRARASRPGVGPVDNRAPRSRGWVTLPVGAPVTGGSGSVASPSRAQASQPTGSQVTARSMASGSMKGPTVGTRKALTARKNPVPPTQARTAAPAPARGGGGQGPQQRGAPPGRGQPPPARPREGQGQRRPQQRRHQPAAPPAHQAGSEVHGDVLGLQVLGDALGAALAADAGLLDPAEGGGRVRDQALVEADHARLQPLDDPERALQVAGVDVGDQPELGIVGGRDRRLLVVEAGHRGHRPEDLLLEDTGVAGHVGQH